MKRIYLIVLSLLILLLVTSGCQLLGNAPEGPAATPISEGFPSPPPTLEATALAVVTTEPEATPATDAVATEPPPPTLPPATVEAVATATTPPTPTEDEPDATSEPEATITVSPTSEAEEPVSPAGELFAPGQQDTQTFTTGEQQAYPFSGTRFTPVVLFVDPDNTLDVSLAAYSGDLSAPGALDGATPLSEANNAPAGRPETLVVSPDANGLFTFVVRAASGDGAATAYLYDLTTPTNGMAVQQQNTLPAGGEQSYDVTSQGARPVLAMVDPVDQSNVVLEIYGADGTQLTSADFSGAGGVEVAYVLPLGTTSYRVVVREATGAPVTFDIAIVTLE